MNMVLVIPSLGGGGAERVMATLANAWAARGDTITLITLSDSAGDVYQLDPLVRRVGLGLLQSSNNILQALANNWRRVFALRRAITQSRPDAVVSFTTNTNMLTILACWWTRIPVVVSERISVIEQPPRGIWALAYASLYRRAHAVVALTRRGAEWLELHLGKPVHVVPNPVIVDKADAGGPAAEELLNRLPSRYRLLAAGRLEHQKGFDLLLTAFAKVAAARPDWGLVIIGEGPERKMLEARVMELGLRDRVLMPGFVQHPQAIMRRADAFVLSSRFEGLPNALIEAMACGLPCVSFDCHTGPSELIQHGVNGLLVPPTDVAALVDALLVVTSETAPREEWGDAARALESRLGLDTVLRKWDALCAGALVAHSIGPKHHRRDVASARRIQA